MKEIPSILRRSRKEYIDLRRQSRQNSKDGDGSFKLTEISGSIVDEDSIVLDSPGFDEVSSYRPSVYTDIAGSSSEVMYHRNGSKACHQTSMELMELEDDDGEVTNEALSEGDAESDSDSVPSQDLDYTKRRHGSRETYNHDNYNLLEPSDSPTERSETKPSPRKAEDFVTWQRIIRLDAIRADPEWISYYPSQATVSEEKALQLAENVGLKDYDHLEPPRIYHAARLVSILEAYAVYDSEIGYCQGMSDLLSPIVSVIEENHVAFWCFVSFMHKARHNFRLDERGIRRQLSIVSKIIKCRVPYLYRHLEKLEAEECFFAYRMVVVLLRRELTFEQTLCLWEVLWADQAAIRAGIAVGSGKNKAKGPT